MSKQALIAAVNKKWDNIIRNPDAYMDGGASRMRFLNTFGYKLETYGLAAANEYFQELLASTHSGDMVCCVMDDIFGMVGVETIDELETFAV